MKKTYLVCPGIVKSKSDGDEHFITAKQLMSLYAVKPYDCLVVDCPESARGIKWEDYIVLRPNTEGNYNLPLN